MSWYKMAQEESLRFTEEMTGYYNDQANIEIGAYRGDDIQGVLQYSIFNDEVYINNILVRHKGKGIGTALYQQLLKDQPDKKINWGMLTDEGAKFQKGLEEKGIIAKKKKKRIKWNDIPVRIENMAQPFRR